MYGCLVTLTLVLADQSLEGTVRREPLNVDALVDEATSGLVLQVVLLGELSETPVLANVDLLSAGQLELGSSKGLSGGASLILSGSDRHQHLTDINSSGNHGWLTEGSSHTGLESIGTSARKHLVDSDNVVRVGSDSKVEEILTSRLDHVLVASDTSSLQSLGRDLFVFIRNKVNSGREHIARSLLVADVVNTQLRVRDTSAVSGLGVRLILAVAIAASWSSTHRIKVTTNNDTNALK
jgi:hypothetical protein